MNDPLVPFLVTLTVSVAAAKCHARTLSLSPLELPALYNSRFGRLARALLGSVALLTAIAALVYGFVCVSRLRFGCLLCEQCRAGAAFRNRPLSAFLACMTLPVAQHGCPGFGLTTR